MLWILEHIIVEKKMLKLREELLAVEEDRMRGSKGYSVEEVTAMMRNAIRGGRRIWNSRVSIV